MTPDPCARVLVVDDDRDFLDSVRDVLELQAISVETATSTREAEAILARGFVPSAILLDLRLGGSQSGDEFAKKLRADARTRGIPLVAVSGDMHKLRAVRGTFDQTLGKPFSADDLVSILVGLCA